MMRVASISTLPLYRTLRTPAAATRRHARTHNHTHVRANVLQHNLRTNPGRIACIAQARAVIPENMRPRLSTLVSVIGHIAFP